MKLRNLLFAALLPLSLTSCQTTSGTPNADIGPIISASVMFYTEGRPDRVIALRTAADALDILAGGIVSKETVLALLRTHLGTSDPKLNLLVTLLVGYFPASNVGIPQNEQLSKLAKDVAAAMRAGFPPV